MRKFSLRAWLVILSLGVMFTLGLYVRLIDLTDPPLDFNPTRQLRSAIIARGLYLQRVADFDPEKRDQAVTFMRAMERLEPPVLESIVALTYRMIGEEKLWVSRIFTSIFWLVGAAVLYDLGRRMESSLAALVGTGYYIFLPFSIRASRSFQPDPGMVMLVLLTAWAIYQWDEMRAWKWVWIAGLFGGMAALIKTAGVFFVAGMAIGLILNRTSDHFESNLETKIKVRGSKIIFDPQIWVLALLIITPTLFYYFLGMGERSSDYLTNWTIFSRWREVLEPSFFIRWLIRVDDIMMLGVVLFSFVGALITRPVNRALLWGFWGGYFLFGVTFPYHTLTHDYYHLPLVALVSLSLVSLAEALIEKISQRKMVYQVLAAGILVMFFVYNGWIGRSIILGQNFGDHPVFWQEVGEAIPADMKSVGLTQDYGFRLMYYGWRKIALWPKGVRSDNFAEETQGASLFVITAKNQLTAELGAYLQNHYPIFAEGTGYLIYDLRDQN